MASYNKEGVLDLDELKDNLGNIPGANVSGTTFPLTVIYAGGNSYTVEDDGNVQIENLPIDDILNSGEYIGLLDDTYDVVKYENNFYKIDINQNVTRLNIEKYFLISEVDEDQPFNRVIIYDNNIENWAQFIDSAYNSYGFRVTTTLITKEEGWILKRRNSPNWVHTSDPIINEEVYNWYID